MSNPNCSENSLSLGNYISIFYRIGSSYLSRKYETYQIGFGQYQFLLMLYLEDGLSQDELTKRVYVDKATTARAINKLKENGYVTVIIDRNDKRKHQVYLTEKSLTLKEELLTIAMEWEDKLLHSLTPEEQKTMFQLFHKISIANEWISNTKEGK